MAADQVVLQFQALQVGLNPAAGPANLRLQSSSLDKFLLTCAECGGLHLLDQAQGPEAGPAAPVRGAAAAAGCASAGVKIYLPVGHVCQREECFSNNIVRSQGMFPPRGALMCHQGCTWMKGPLTLQPQPCRWVLPHHMLLTHCLNMKLKRRSMCGSE